MAGLDWIKENNSFRIRRRIRVKDSILFQDSDLLLSCGKDNKILCWNPNSNVPGGEVLCELDASSQWNFEVSWCPRNPGVLASSSFDGKISVYSLMGGQEQVKRIFLFKAAVVANYPLIGRKKIQIATALKEKTKENSQKFTSLDYF